MPNLILQSARKKSVRIYLRQLNMYWHYSQPTRGTPCLDNVFSNLGDGNV